MGNEFHMIRLNWFLNTSHWPTFSLMFCFHCFCFFLLKSNNQLCLNKFTEVTKLLLFTDADAKATYISSLNASHILVNGMFRHPGNKRPIALDYDSVEERVFWTDIGEGRILSAFLNATSVKSLFDCNVEVPDGLAIDNVGRHIYWTDAGTNRIEVGSLDGTKRKVLIKNGLDKPRAIELDEKNG